MAAPLETLNRGNPYNPYNGCRHKSLQSVILRLQFGELQPPGVTDCISDALENLFSTKQWAVREGSRAPRHLRYCGTPSDFGFSQPGRGMISFWAIGAFSFPLPQLTKDSVFLKISTRSLGVQHSTSDGGISSEQVLSSTGRTSDSKSDNLGSSPGGPAKGRWLRPLGTELGVYNQEVEVTGQRPRASR